MATQGVGLEEALLLLRESIAPLPAEKIALAYAAGRVSTQTLLSLVDCPSVDSSSRDGYAVASSHTAGACAENPARLCVHAGEAAGHAGAIGRESDSPKAVKVRTGGPIPAGADCVIAKESVSDFAAGICVDSPVKPGSNICARGSEVALGEVVLRAGQRITPAVIALLTAGGHTVAKVHRLPRVAIIATGSAVVAPGQPLKTGRVYASNLIAIESACRLRRMDVHTYVIGDERDRLAATFAIAASGCDALIISGGAWTGEHDRMSRVLDDLGWKPLFRRLRMGPGKAVGFGMLGDKPVFVLPGGPPSNLTGFVKIVLPGLLRMSGNDASVLKSVTVLLAHDVVGPPADWTQFAFGTLTDSAQGPVFSSLKLPSRLQLLAEAQALVAVREGETLLHAGTHVPAELLGGVLGG